MRARRNAIFGMLYILPSFLLIMAFSIIPIAMSAYFSFTKFNILQSPQWLGLSTSARMIKDTFIHASLKNTLLFTLITVPVQTVISLLIAVCIADVFTGRFGRFVKSSLFVPVIASGVLVGTLWFTLLSPRGVVNQLLQALGLQSVNWLGSKSTSLLSISMISAWKNIGYFLVIFYAGIMDIPRSLYEAAEVDGANRLQRFLHITLPGLSSIAYLVVTLGTIWSFQVFDLVYTMTGGGPGTSTVTLVLTIYNTAFKEFSMGYACAIALLMLGLVMLVSILQKALMRGGR